MSDAHDDNNCPYEHTAMRNHVVPPTEDNDMVIVALTTCITDSMPELMGLAYRKGLVTLLLSGSPDAARKMLGPGAMLLAGIRAAQMAPEWARALLDRMHEPEKGADFDALARDIIEMLPMEIAHEPQEHSVG